MIIYLLQLQSLLVINVQEIPFYYNSFVRDDCFNILSCAGDNQLRIMAVILFVRMAQEITLYCYSCARDDCFNN